MLLLSLYCCSCCGWIGCSSCHIVLAPQKPKNWRCCHFCWTCCCHIVGNHQRIVMLFFLSMLFLLVVVGIVVEKLQFSFSMISCLLRLLTLLALPVAFLKIACLHVSFTPYENFTNYLKMHCLLGCFPLSLIRSIRNQKLNNQTYIHLYTGSLIHNYINGRSLSGDLLSIIMPFCMTRD